MNSSFFEMGGYAAYVWPAYGVTALIMGGLVWVSVAALRRAEKTWDGMKRNRADES